MVDVPTWLRTALQYAPLAERAGRGLARFVRRLRGRETPSLEDAREADESAQEAIALGRANIAAREEELVAAIENARRLLGEDTPAETPRAKRGTGG